LEKSSILAKITVMAFNPEKMERIPEVSPEAKYLEQGIKAQKLLNEALHKARLRKKFIEQKKPERIPREEVEMMKEKYDNAARDLGILREKLSSEAQEEFAKLDTLEDFQKAYVEEMSKTQRTTLPPETEVDRDFFIPEEGEEEIKEEEPLTPDKDLFIPGEDEEKAA
jgi:hypothetical protein